jgi:hypothetical protein
LSEGCKKNRRQWQDMADRQNKTVADQQDTEKPDRESEGSTVGSWRLLGHDLVDELLVIVLCVLVIVAILAIQSEKLFKAIL